MTDAAPGSSLARLRGAYKARQEAEPPKYVDIWDDGDLVAQVARTEDMDASTGIMRTMGALVSADVAASLGIQPETLADILASTTVALFARESDGTLEPMLTASGEPLRFGADFGVAIGVPEITTAQGAVFAAFTSPATEDAPPTLDSLRLMTTVSRVATALMSTRPSARETVGKASATSNGATPR